MGWMGRRALVGDEWDAWPHTTTRARERDDGESAMLDVNLLRPDKGGDPVREREASAR